MIAVPLASLVSLAGKRAGTEIELPVYSVTKHAGFVPSLEYFKKQVFSRDVEGYKLVEPGDFAYATIHLDEGSIGIAPERGLISPMYTVFKTDNARVDPRYLIRFLRSPRALAHYPHLGKGAVHRRKAISLAALGTLPVPLPALHEQRRIAVILDQADALRTKRLQALAHLKDLLQSIFIEMLKTENLTPVRASEIMPLMRNGLSPTTGGAFSANILTLSAITRGAFDPTAVKRGSFRVSPPQEKRVSAQDFMICRGNGNKSLVGQGVFSPTDLTDVVFPDTVIAGRIDPTRIELPFLEMAWRQPGVRRQIEAVARTTNGTYKVNQATLASVTIPIPSLARQREFGAAVARLHLQRAAYRSAAASASELISCLQYQSFRTEA